MSNSRSDDEPAWQWRVLIRYLIKENEGLKQRVALLEKRQGVAEYSPTGVDTTALVKKIMQRDFTPYQPHDWRGPKGRGDSR